MTHDCTMASKVKRLLIPCSLQLKAAFEAPDHWFEIVDNRRYLRLWIERQRYTPIRDEKPDQATYIDTLVRPIARITTARVGFEATVIDQYMDMLYLIEAIAHDSTTPNKREHKPLIVLDFVRPEGEDRVIALRQNREAFTARTGRIIGIKESSGAIGTGTKLYGKGFAIAFKELGRRRIIG
ncbi:hypothetical protein H6G00_02005 [Leptolyngbya sp. FACHB-541]|uniref:hypothetical protein n=1 Tax=Leptolyngbya sp. FACHB-541 TaxID=2692810 RepID=UPI001683D0C9|nr:hypothetical protein [Leptolyngbya sp. FACHB-541]MBD1995406.1 hypothetical protein [Leptolyngbya sp. FACHB-541]